MVTRIYIDTNVYLDYLEERKDSIRPLNEFAFSVFRRTFECEFEIVVSDWLMRELKNWCSQTKLLGLLLNDLKSLNKLAMIGLRPEDEIAARRTGNYGDALHAIAARKAGCRFIVTRNIDDFLCLPDIVEPKLPEEL